MSEIPKEDPVGHDLNGGTFIGARDPMWTLEHEQPWHRLAAHFFSMGDTARDVAKKVERSLPAVHNVLRQPWFQKLVTQLMAARGDKDISKLFRAEQFNCYSTIVDLRDNPNTPAALKLKAAQDLLDRSMGKATQRVEVAHETISDNPVEEFERLQKENERLRKDVGRSSPWASGGPGASGLEEGKP